LGPTSGDTPAEGEEDEYLKEWLKDFSQVAETKITTALEVVAKEENENKMLTPWEMELEMMEDWLNHLELVDDFHEQTVMNILEKENSEELLKNFSQGAEQMMITTMSRHASIDEREFQSE
jgi:hypothetical protein